MNKGRWLILVAGLAANLSGCTTTDMADFTQTLSTFAADLARQLLAAALL